MTQIAWTYILDEYFVQMYLSFYCNKLSLLEYRASKLVSAKYWNNDPFIWEIIIILLVVVGVAVDAVFFLFPMNKTRLTVLCAVCAHFYFIAGVIGPERTIQQCTMLKKCELFSMCLMCKESVDGANQHFFSRTCAFLSVRLSVRQQTMPLLFTVEPISHIIFSNVFFLSLSNKCQL